MPLSFTGACAGEIASAKANLGANARRPVTSWVGRGARATLSPCEGLKGIMVLDSLRLRGGMKMNIKCTRMRKVEVERSFRQYPDPTVSLGSALSVARLPLPLCTLLDHLGYSGAPNTGLLNGGAPLFSMQGRLCNRVRRLLHSSSLVTNCCI